MFATCLGVAVLVVVAMSGLRHSRFGRVLRALSTNERAVAGFGADVDRAKLSAFGVSGFIAGLAGCLLVVVNQQYVESSFTVTTSLAVFTATAVGGLGSVVGAVAGGGPVRGEQVFLPPSWQLFPAAFGILLVLMLFPGGIAGLLFAGRDQLLPGRPAARRRRPSTDLTTGVVREPLASPGGPSGNGSRPRRRPGAAPFRAVLVPSGPAKAVNPGQPAGGPCKARSIAGLGGRRPCSPWPSSSRSSCSIRPPRAPSTC